MRICSRERVRVRVRVRANPNPDLLEGELGAREDDREVVGALRVEQRERRAARLVRVRVRVGVGVSC